ncbi:hypothetical protein RHCRD62_80182 [Rhodococcus sp. RD6.2]|nr:hypothetical protein RHCRD62_80182 [Rhodococcus sp. RD6.2]
MGRVASTHSVLAAASADSDEHPVRAAASAAAASTTAGTVRRASFMILRGSVVRVSVAGKFGGEREHGYDRRSMSVVTSRPRPVLGTAHDHLLAYSLGNPN